MSRSIRFAISAVAASVLLSLPGLAAASVFTDSSNWSGFAVHRTGVRFQSASAAWTQPRASCRRGHSTYSAFWVGLGGFSFRSTALEQVGTELDCARSGRQSSSAWVELVPAASRTISLKVRPGDSMLAAVKVQGHSASLAIADLTSHHSYVRTFKARLVDVNSAEWIAEAPSDCTDSGNCQTLPLANFGSATFSLAAVTTTAGHTGSISDPAWSATRIRLNPASHHFTLYHGSGIAAGAAIPSTLSAGGSSFSVRFAYAQVRAAAAAASVAVGHLFHAQRP